MCFRLPVQVLFVQISIAGLAMAEPGGTQRVSGLPGGTPAISRVEAGRVPPGPPLPDPSTDLNGTVIPCTVDDDCSNTSYCVPPPTGVPGDGTCYVPKTRYLSMNTNPANAGKMTARRVSVVTSEGPVVIGWVIELFGPCFSTPVYRDWNILSTVMLLDCHISPGRSYLIQAIAQGQDIADELNYSEPLELKTSQLWGDVVGTVSNGIASPPDCVVNIGDCEAIMRGFQGSLTAPRSWLDIAENKPNTNIDADDVQRSFDSIRGFPYPYADPCTCAGLAACPAEDDPICPRPQYLCGNGVIEPGEHCDDGGTVSGDGCDSVCQDETINGPTISLVPVGASGVHTIEGNEIILDGADQTVRLEIRLDNWDPVTDVGLCPDQTRCSVSQQDCPVGVCEQATGLLSAYQARIDSAGYAGVLAPPVIPCTTKLDCEVFGSPSSHSGPPCDTTSGTCGPDASGFIDPEHVDYVFSGRPVIAPVNNVVGSWSYATAIVIPEDSPSYAGMDKYAGTLVLNAPAQASGSFTIGFVNDPRETFMHDANGATIFPVRTIPAIITVQPDAIPTVSDWGLIVLVLLLLAVGTVSIRRRRHYGINVF